MKKLRFNVLTFVITLVATLTLLFALHYDKKVQAREVGSIPAELSAEYKF